MNERAKRLAFAQALAADEASDIAVDDPAENESGSSLTSAAHELMGRAGGLAAGFGAATVTCEHVLIAYVWDPSTSVDIEEFVGVTREAVLEELSRLGVAVPEAPLPSRPLPSGARVYVPYEALMRVVDALRERLPRDSGLGFNHGGKSEAWVLAHCEIDLERELRAVLDEFGIAPVDSTDS